MIAKIAFQLFIALIPVYVLVEISAYRTVSYDESGGPAQFPRIVALFMLSMLAIEIVLAVLRGTRDRKAGNKKAITKQEKPVVFLSLFKGPPGILLLATCAYAALLPVLGFLVTSILFFIGTGMYLTQKADGRIVRKTLFIRSTVFILFAIGVFILFERVMRIGLPSGVFGF